MAMSTQSEAEAEALLDRGAAALGFALGDRERSALRQYRQELLRWSERTNLTALRDPVRIARDGILDSLACLPHVPASARRAADIGSGAGFPAIPMAILRPDLRFCLVEAARKKTTFLRHVCRLLRLSGVEVLWGRAEAVSATADHAGRYDLAMARAVAHPGEQARLAAPFLGAGGAFLAQVGSSCATDDLLAGLRGAGFRLEKEAPLPGILGGPGRRLILLRRG
jgi:16S rRNA (guanine527-N7)-methyltransferase